PGLLPRLEQPHPNPGANNFHRNAILDKCVSSLGDWYYWFVRLMKLVRFLRTSILVPMKSIVGRSDGAGSRGRMDQCDTAAAACSSISAPVVKRSSAKGAARGCGSSRAIVWANTCPAPGVALNPPVPQPPLR